jgi:hypothetical protein
MTITVPQQHSTISNPTPPTADRLWVRVLARLRATSLDRRIATGDIARSDPALAARARLIVSARNREDLAESWEHLLARAGQPVAPRSPQVSVRSGAVLAVELQLRELIALIRQPGRANPEGIARAGLLLTDGTGPIYNSRRASELLSAIEAATSALRS